MIDNQKSFLDAIGKCEILFEEEVISNENIIKTVMEFFAGGFFTQAPRRRNLLHTGSIAFDATALFMSALADVLVFTKQVSLDFWERINPGDLVLYTNPQTGESRRCEVLDIRVGEELVVRYQNDNRIVRDAKWILPWSSSNLQLFSPNAGGKRIGRRGLPVAATHARKLFEELFGVPAHSLRRVNSYTAVVADREYAERLYNGLAIQYRNGNKTRRIDFKEIIGGIYGHFENDDDWDSLGGDLSGRNAILRFCPRLSIARQIMARQGSLLLLSGLELSNDAATFRELSDARKPNFIYASTPIGYWYSFDKSRVLELIGPREGEETDILACTKAFLSQLRDMDSMPEPDDSESHIIKDLRLQIRHGRDRTIEWKCVDGFLTAEEYGQWLSAVRHFKQIPFDVVLSSMFLDKVCGLFSFLRGSVFDTQTLDTHFEWKARKNLVLSPAKRLEDIQQACNRLPDDNIKEAGLRLYELLCKAHHSILENNEKQKVLEQILWTQASGPRRRRIAVIVPQAGFKVLCENLGWMARAREENVRLEIATAGTFRPGNTRYDVIVSIGGLLGKRFSPFFCTCADSVQVLLYGCELAMFRARAKEANQLEQLLNGEQLPEEPPQDDQNTQLERELDESFRAFREQQENQRILQHLRQRSGQRHGQLSEVAWIGKLEETGEKVFFTRFCRPYVMNENGQLSEKSMDRVSPGDTILFMRNNGASKDIVDIMLADVIASGRGRKLDDDFRKSQHWREALKTYVEQNNLTAVSVAHQMNDAVTSATINRWLDNESHIVGPRAPNLQLVAELTGDREMLLDIDGYCDACANIRRMRMDLLRKLGEQIRSDIGSTKYKDMVRLCVLEDLQPVQESLRLETWFVNRPISVEIEEESAI